MSKRRIRRGPDLPEQFDGWLWDDALLIPRNELTEIVGHDGSGKTSFVLGLVAGWTKQRYVDRPETIFLSMQEDGEAITKGRLKTYGADLARVVVQPHLPEGEPDIPCCRPHTTSSCSRRTSARRTRRVAVLDSLDVHVDSLGVQAARQSLNKMRAIAQRLKVTFILVGHFNKAGRSLDQAIGGGRGVKAAMRCILVWGERPPTAQELLGALFTDDEHDSEDEPDTTHALAVHKNSYGPKFPTRQTMLYVVEKTEFPYKALGRIELLQFNHVDDSDTVSPQGHLGTKRADPAGPGEARHQARSGEEPDRAVHLGPLRRVDACLRASEQDGGRRSQGTHDQTGSWPIGQRRSDRDPEATRRRRRPVGVADQVHDPR